MLLLLSCPIAAEGWKYQRPGGTQGPVTLRPGEATGQRLGAPRLQQQLLQTHVLWGSVFPQPSNTQPPPARFAHGEGPAQQPPAAHGSSPPTVFPGERLLGSVWASEHRALTQRRERFVTPPAGDGGGRGVGTAAWRSSARRVCDRLLPPHHTGVLLNSAQSSFLFFTPQVAGPGTLKVSIYIHKIKKENKQPTMRFCLNSAVEARERLRFAESAFSSSPQKARCTTQP